jgi:hypothetical protein
MELCYNIPVDDLGCVWFDFFPQRLRFERRSSSKGPRRATCFFQRGCVLAYNSRSGLVPAYFRVCPKITIECHRQVGYRFGLFYFVPLPSLDSLRERLPLSNLVTIFRIVIEVLLDYTGLPCTAFQVLLIVGCCGRNVLMNWNI